MAYRNGMDLCRMTKCIFECCKYDLLEKVEGKMGGRECPAEELVECTMCVSSVEGISLYGEHL